MKAIGAAAVAALVVVSRIAFADAPMAAPIGADVGAGEAVRAAGEARFLLAVMETNAEQARGAHRAARQARAADVVACTNDALTRADVALRWARDDAARVASASRANDVETARAALASVRRRSVASHEAMLTALSCNRTEVTVIAPRTQVTVQIDPMIAQIEPGFPATR